MRLWNYLHRKWIKLRLQPIRVYCMHHVCAQFDPLSMHEGDWMQIDDFKKEIEMMLSKGIVFISMKEALKHLKHDFFRYRKYAVLTFDDGYSSIKEIIPWLNERHIPMALFVNGKYTDGKSFRKTSMEQYMTWDELRMLKDENIEIGSHGWEHISANAMSLDEFNDAINRNTDLLFQHPCYMPVFAYTYGVHTIETDAILQKANLLPVYIDGQLNYNNTTCIHRELMK